MENLKKETLFVLFGIGVLLGIGTYKFFNNKEYIPPTHFDDKKKPDHFYYLIVGSFEYEYLAQNFSDSLGDLGFDSEVLKKTSGVNRVSIYKTKDQQDATEMKKLYRENIKKIWTHYE